MKPVNPKTLVTIAAEPALAADWSHTASPVMSTRRTSWKSNAFHSSWAALSASLMLVACGGGSADNASEVSSSDPAPAPAPAPMPAPAPPACDTLDKRLRATTVTVGGNAAPNDEYTPAVIAPRSDGSSLLAWTDRDAKTIKMASLTTSDALERSLPGVAGLEVHAVLPTATGAAMAVVADDPDIYSPKYCQGSSTPNNNVCGKMDLVRVDTNGNQLSRTTLTKKSNVDSVDAQFIWWYGHTARLATDGSNIAVYYRSAMSTARPNAPGEVDIHAGDTLKFVDGNGALIPGGWDWGCSHSWSVRVAHNGTQWGASCHGDAYPNAMQHARLSTPSAAPNNLQWLTGTDPTQRALGGLVSASDGFWMDFIQFDNGTPSLKLAKLPNSGSTLVQQTTVGVATGIDGSSYPFRPYMAAYGTGQLLMGWKSGGQLMLAVANATTGAIVEGPVASGLPIDSFQEMISAPNGDVVWAHSSGGTQIKINRVAACKLAAQ